MSGPLLADIERAHPFEPIGKLKHFGIGQFGSIHSTCLSALVSDRATERWYPIMRRLSRYLRFARFLPRQAREDCSGWHNTRADDPNSGRDVGSMICFHP